MSGLVTWLPDEKLDKSAQGLKQDVIIWRLKKKDSETYRNENERAAGISRGCDAERSVRKQDKGTRVRQIREGGSDRNPL